jgi:hypothetical protein
MSSSPVSDGQMNSVDPEPPIAPLDASTGIAGMPIRAYARM